MGEDEDVYDGMTVMWVVMMMSVVMVLGGDDDSEDDVGDSVVDSHVGGDDDFKVQLDLLMEFV